MSKRTTLSVPCKPHERKIIGRAATRVGSSSSNYARAAALRQARAELSEEEIKELERNQPQDHK